MEVTQIAEIVNETTAEITGTEPLDGLDLNKIVDAGAEVLDTDKVDHYVRRLTELVRLFS